MNIKTTPHVRKENAQTMVEFALVLPMLLMLLFGIIEFGRMFFTFVAVESASREGARIGSAAGSDTDRVFYFQNCQAMRTAAVRMGFFANVQPADITIEYDHGPATQDTPFGSCPQVGLGPEDIELGDRVVVTVEGRWEPLVPVTGLTGRTFRSVSRRTIIRSLDVVGVEPISEQPEVYMGSAGEPCDEGSPAPNSAPTCRRTILVMLSHPWNDTVTVEINLGGSAVRNEDYTVLRPTSLRVNISAGTQYGEFEIRTIADAYNEDDETIILTIASAYNATISTSKPTTAVLTILNDDPEPVVRFMVPTRVEDEGIRSISLRTQLEDSMLSGKPVSVAFQVIGGTATEGEDYSVLSNIITISPGNNASPTTDNHLNIVDDVVFEGNETIELLLYNPTNATLSSDPNIRMTITLTDNDVPPVIYFSPAEQSAMETVGTLYVFPTLNKPAGTDVTMQYTLSGTATLGSDYTISPSTVTIAKGQVSAQMTINVISDGITTEGNENIIITMANVVNATVGTPNQHIATITESIVPPTVWFQVAEQTVFENAGRIYVRVRLSFPSTQIVTVPFIVSGTALSGGVDYTIGSGTLTIPAGQITRDLAIDIVDDNIHETDETIIITMGNVVNAVKSTPNVHTITIKDNEAMPTVSFLTGSQQVIEGAGTGNVTVQVILSGPSSRDITVPIEFDPLGTATPSADYTVLGIPILIPPGAVNASFTIRVLDDNVFKEKPETVIAMLGTPTNATVGFPDTFTLTIVDNDQCPTYQVQLGTDKITFLITHNVLGAQPTSISQIEGSWSSPGGQRMDGITWVTSTNVLYNGKASSPFLIPSGSDPWTTTGNRNVAAGISSIPLTLSFSKGFGTASGYYLAINFANSPECVVIFSK